MGLLVVCAGYVDAVAVSSSWCIVFRMAVVAFRAVFRCPASKYAWCEWAVVRDVWIAMLVCCSW